MIASGSTPLQHINTNACSGNSIRGGVCATCGEPVVRYATVVTAVPPEKKREPTPWHRKYAAYAPRARESERIIVRPESHARSNPRPE